MNEATPTKTTMRQLLARWAEVEPDACQLMPEYQQINVSVKLIGGYTSHHVEDEDFTNLDLAWIQFATQQAIVERGWGYSLDLSLAHKRYYGAVRTSTVRGEGFSDANPTEALLSAYLRALEEK